MRVGTLWSSFCIEGDADAELAVVYLCDACLTTFAHRGALRQHTRHCCRHAYHVPGREIYRCPVRALCVFELDGRRSCAAAAIAQRLTRLARLLVRDKVTIEDVHFFYYYVLYKLDDAGYHFVGYFSKECSNPCQTINTLSCMAILPPYRRQGYGALLVELSYELARREGVVGTPERPLSEGGSRLFRRMWAAEVVRALGLLHAGRTLITPQAISQASGLIVEDVIVALQDLHCLYTLPKQGPFIVLDKKAVKDACASHILQPDMLEWAPA